MPLRAELLRLGCPAGRTTPPTRPRPDPATYRSCGHPGCRAALRLGISVPDPPLTLPTSEHAARRPHMSPAAEHGRRALEHAARRPRSALGARARCPAPERVVRRRACRPGPTHVAGRLLISLGNAHVVRRRPMSLRYLRMSSGIYIRRSPSTTYRSGSAHVVRRLACRPTPARAARRLRISLGARMFPSEPVDDPPAPPRARAPRGASRRGGSSLDTTHAANSPA